MKCTTKYTAQKMKFSIKDFLNKCDQINWNQHLLNSAQNQSRWLLQMCLILFSESSIWDKVTINIIQSKY